jgi:electron transport complex protein RnfE
VRISTYIIIIATFVTVADLHAEGVHAGHPQGARRVHPAHRGELPDPRPAGGVRQPEPTAEGAARTRRAWRSASRSPCCASGATREILGNGSLFGFDLFGEHFEPWVIMILPPGGFIMLGMILLFFNWLQEMERSAAAEARRRRGGRVVSGTSCGSSSARCW